MKLVVLYRPKSEHARQVEEYLHEFQARYATTAQVLDVDSKEGMIQAELYDIVSYPAILALNEDGQLLMSWVGGELPLMDEVASYTRGWLPVSNR